MCSKKPICANNTVKCTHTWSMHRTRSWPTRQSGWGSGGGWRQCADQGQVGWCAAKGSKNGCCSNRGCCTIDNQVTHQQHQRKSMTDLRLGDLRFFAVWQHTHRQASFLFLLSLRMGIDLGVDAGTRNGSVSTNTSCCAHATKKIQAKTPKQIVHVLMRSNLNMHLQTCFMSSSSNNLENWLCSLNPRVGWLMSTD